MNEDNNKRNDQPTKKNALSNNTQPELRQISIEELKQILKEHIKWLKSKGKEGKRADLHFSNLKAINLKKTILSHANLQQSNFSEAVLEQANFIRANLKQSNLSQANIGMANLSKANLEGAKIIGSILRNSNLTEANLKNSSCRGTDFEGAIFVKANLQGADLLSAFFEETDLSNANLTRVKNLTIAQLSGAKTLYQAKLDPELMEQVKKSYPYLLREP